MAIAAVAFFGAVAAGLVIVGTVPRLLSRALKPGRVYPLYGLRHGLQRAVSRLRNVTFFNALFGDSSAVARYLSLPRLPAGAGAIRPAPTSAWRSSTRCPALTAVGHGHAWSPTACR